jgi:protein-tyrosine phosphatase
MKILMVCLGNICRSPLAEGILRKKLERRMPELFIDSAGIGGWHEGQSPDPRSVAVAREFGLDISQQKARKFRNDDFEKFDLIFAMDRSNYNDLLALKPSAQSAGKLYLLLEYASFDGSTDVPDPYYGGKQEFEAAYRLLDDACNKVAEEILKALN